jgi:hypothetical protein
MSSRLWDESDDTYLTRIACEFQQLGQAAGSSLERSRFDRPMEIRAHMRLRFEFIAKHNEFVGEFRRRLADARSSIS